MALIDILFWLLVLMMGGIAWAVEAGLGYRHRKVLASSVLASLGAGIIIMFWIEDKTYIEYAPRGPVEVKKKKGGERGMIQQEHEIEGSEGQGSKSGGSGSASGSGAGAGAAKPAGDIEIDESKVVYSRTPFKDCPTCPDLVIVPEGTFQMGSPADEAGRTADELPPVLTEIAKPFAIGRLEVLRSEFETFVKETGYETQTQCNIGSKRRGRFTWKSPGFEQDERHAATCLTIDDVKGYLDWISKKTERDYRLPTEAEWEYAARSQTKTPYWTGDTLWRHQGNFGRSRDGTTVAGSFQMNLFGLADMAGNLWELTSECNAAAAPASDTKCNRIIKGGGWNSPAAASRHAARGGLADGTATNFVGIRVMRGLDARDNDKRLSKEQRQALLRDEKLAAEIKAKEIADTEKAKRDAREAAAAPPPAKDAKDPKGKAKAAAPPLPGKK